MSKSFGEKVIELNRNLTYADNLPQGFQVINPFVDHPETLEVMQTFYHKFYHDTHQRKLILGINPSRHGAGVTGVPFTDTKRLGKRLRHHHEISAYTRDFICIYV